MNLGLAITNGLLAFIAVQLWFIALHLDKLARKGN